MLWSVFMVTRSIQQLSLIWTVLQHLFLSRCGEYLMHIKTKASGDLLLGSFKARVLYRNWESCICCQLLSQLRWYISYTPWSIIPRSSYQIICRAFYMDTWNGGNIDFFFSNITTTFHQVRENCQNWNVFLLCMFTLIVFRSQHISMSRHLSQLHQLLMIPGFEVSVLTKGPLTRL